MAGLAIECATHSLFILVSSSIERFQVTRKISNKCWNIIVVVHDVMFMFNMKIISPLHTYIHTYIHTHRSCFVVIKK